MPALDLDISPSRPRDLLEEFLGSDRAPTAMPIDPPIKAKS